MLCPAYTCDCSCKSTQSVKLQSRHYIQTPRRYTKLKLASIHQTWLDTKHWFLISLAAPQEYNQQTDCTYLYCVVSQCCRYHQHIYLVKLCISCSSKGC